MFKVELSPTPVSVLCYRSVQLYIYWYSTWRSDKKRGKNKYRFVKDGMEKTLVPNLKEALLLKRLWRSVFIPPQLLTFKSSHYFLSAPITSTSSLTSNRRVRSAVFCRDFHPTEPQPWLVSVLLLGHSAYYHHGSWAGLSCVMSLGGGWQDGRPDVTRGGPFWWN